MSRKCMVCTVIAAASTLASGAAWAADTIETFDEGAADFELYSGMEGLGLGPNERSIFADTMLAFGIVDRFSGYLRGAGAANEQLANGSGEVGAGVFGTPLDSDHVDLDLIVDFCLGSDGPAITPAVELNLDAAPDLAFWGAYLRAEERFAGRREVPAAEAPAGAPEAVAEPNHELAPETSTTLGLYLTVAADHQLLVEADAVVINNPAEDDDTVDFGGIATGYNVVVHDSVELINQLFLDVPVRAADELAFGVAIGLIATIGPRGMPPKNPMAPAAKARPKRLSSFRPGR
ncbi:MAG: hypothetical protein JRI68_21985 [Deltaproteobacteria bacterium]|nr:hypothetical protein [Deltaproteobacteria bacterium]